MWVVFVFLLLLRCEIKKSNQIIECSSIGGGVCASHLHSRSKRSGLRRERGRGNWRGMDRGSIHNGPIVETSLGSDPTNLERALMLAIITATCCDSFHVEHEMRQIEQSRARRFSLYIPRESNCPCDRYRTIPTQHLVLAHTHTTHNEILSDGGEEGPAPVSRSVRPHGTSSTFSEVMPHAASEACI